MSTNQSEKEVRKQQIEKELQEQLISEGSFKQISVKNLYKRYINVWNRTVEFENGKTVEWDVAGHSIPNPAFAVIFPYQTKTKTVTLLREYAQGPNEMLYTFPSGAYDRMKHSSILDCAKAELSEEAHLKDGEWVNLLPESKKEGIVELKWCRNKFYPFLVIDAEEDPTPLARDEEGACAKDLIFNGVWNILIDCDYYMVEVIEIRRGVSVAELRGLMMGGEVALPSVQTALMALGYLEQRGLL